MVRKLCCTQIMQHKHVIFILHSVSIWGVHFLQIRNPLIKCNCYSSFVVFNKHLPLTITLSNEMHNKLKETSLKMYKTWWFVILKRKRKTDACFFNSKIVVLTLRSLQKAHDLFKELSHLIQYREQKKKRQFQV